MYGNWAFRWKMIFLFSAILFTFTIHRKVVSAEESRIAPVWRISVALVSLLLWSAVGLGGRAIGYVTTSTSSVNVSAP